MKRVPVSLSLFNQKFSWDCPYCGYFNVCDIQEETEETLVQCFCCQRKRKGIPRDRWYKFTKGKNKVMRLKQKEYKAKQKKGVKKK
jgi:hypothetical protein